ncbi:replicative DNA helicase [Peptoniphilus lacrimalis]|uniref:replicative DNA helicase n=1 Tax=Peptoniphilus lacrimalis TaxID=33031 RepID=UPI0032C06D96
MEDMELNNLDTENLRIPPHNNDAETSALGAMLLSKEAITLSIEIISVEDFYSPAHQKIYSSILSIYNRNEACDVVTLSEELLRTDSLEEIGGSVYLADISSSVAAVSNSRYYLNIIKEKSILRKLIDSSSKVITKAYSPEAAASSLIELAEKSIFEINEDSNRHGLVNIRDIVLDSFSQMEQRAQNPGGLTGLSTGFVDLDRKLSGLQKSDLVLIAARPSMGKTALMVNIATNAALKNDARVAIFSLEMSKNQLVQRVISSNAHVDLQKVISGDINEDEWTKIINAMPIISDLKIEIDDTAAISPLELKAKCRRMKVEKGLDLIVIDYLQLMQMSGRVESRQQEISTISRNLKAIAKELDVPVIALSQLSRAPELRSDHRPILSDLRESGAIEQDADVVMFLYRDEYYNKEESEKPNIGELIIAKHRNGPTGTVELVFKKEYTKFLNLERGGE